MGFPWVTPHRARAWPIIAALWLWVIVRAPATPGFTPFGPPEAGEEVGLDESGDNARVGDWIAQGCKDGRGLIGQSRTVSRLDDGHVPRWQTDG